MTRNPLQFPLTVGTCLLAAGVSIWWWLGNDVSSLFLRDGAIEQQPWRLLTSTLLHADVIHFVFNALWMFRFGILLEERVGAARFGGLFLLLAVGSGAAEHALFGGGVGLSGVVYGLFGFLWAGAHSAQRYAREAIDKRTTVMFVAWFFFCIAATYANILRIANVAHGMGAILGASVGFAVYHPRARIPAAVATAVLVVGSVLAGGPFRQTVNLDPDAFATDVAKQAETAFAAGDIEGSIPLYQEAIQRTPDVWYLHYNLAVSYVHLERFVEAAPAAEKANELERTAETREFAASTLVSAGVQHSTAERWQEALDAFEKAATYNDDAPHTRAMIARCLVQLGRPDDAEAVLDAPP